MRVAALGFFIFGKNPFPTTETTESIFCRRYVEKKLGEVPKFEKLDCKLRTKQPDLAFLCKYCQNDVILTF